MHMKKIVFIIILLLSLLSASYAAKDGEPLKKSKMNTAQAVVLGVTEGLTEYLPVSSTGHLYLVERLIGMGRNAEDEEAADSYVIAVQIGAILAVLWLYSKRVKKILMGICGRDKEGGKLALNIIVAFLPAVIIGLLLENAIKAYLFGLWPIAAAWLVGGAAILLMDKKYPDLHGGKELESINLKQAFIIGIVQCVAMWPGTSRSLVTILAGKFTGLKTAAAVEFSFLLGLITLGAATLYEMAKKGSAIISAFGWMNPVIGIVIAFFSAVVAVKWMVSYLNRRGMDIFGYYRIVLAVFAFALIFMGTVR